MIYDSLIAPFVDFEFMRRALAAVIALALGGAPIGVFLMLRRMSLVGDAMAHAILPGAAIGFLLSGLNLFAMTLGGLIAGFTVAILGGLGNSMAAVAAGFILGILESFSIWVMPTAYKDAISISLLLAMLFLRPSGLFGNREAFTLKEF